MVYGRTCKMNLIYYRRYPLLQIILQMESPNAENGQFLILLSLSLSLWLSGNSSMGHLNCYVVRYHAAPLADCACLQQQKGVLS